MTEEMSFCFYDPDEVQGNIFSKRQLLPVMSFMLINEGDGPGLKWWKVSLVENKPRLSEIWRTAS